MAQENEKIIWIDQPMLWRPSEEIIWIFDDELIQGLTPGNEDHERLF